MAKQKDTQGTAGETSGDKFEARRRLLKASAAAPLVATLIPGAALAQSSFNCVTQGMNVIDDLQGLPPASPVNDKAVRVEGKYWEHIDPKQRHAKDMYEVKDQYYRVKDNKIPQNPPDPLDYDIMPYYFVEYFSVDPTDGSITPEGVYPEVTGMGTIVADSCWMSMNMDLIHAQNLNP